MKKKLLLVLMLLFFTVGVVNANATVINFDTLSEYESVTNQFAGLTFSNASVLTAGSSLNEFEFPPSSGSNVIVDDGGPITISFANLMTEVGAYFTYLTPLSLSFYDNTNTLIGTASSAFFSNMASSGDIGSLPNEYLNLIWNSGISRVEITGDIYGYSFTMDDLTMTPLTTAVPEPSILLLLGCGLFGIAIKKRLG